MFSCTTLCSHIHRQLLKSIKRRLSNAICGAITREAFPLYDKNRESDILKVHNLPRTVDAKALQEEKDHMMIYIDILNDLMEGETCHILKEAHHRLVEALKHTLPYGKQYEGLGILHAYKLIESTRNLTYQNIKLAHVLSWCFAMQCGSFFISDDIIDGEGMRKCFPCWHTQENIGMTAINDGFLIQNAAFLILSKYLSSHPNYLPILELFHKSNYKIALGQVIDMTTTVNGRPRFEDFTNERINFMANYKHYAFCYIIKLTLFLAQINDGIIHKKATDIASKVNMLFMVHNDVMDVFGAYRVAGKIGTDISKGKCSWLAVEALQRGTTFQKQTFVTHYGKDLDQSVQIIQDIYKELDLLNVYVEFERNSISSIYEEAEHISHIIPKRVFENFLSDILMYKLR